MIDIREHGGSFGGSAGAIIKSVQSGRTTFPKSGTSTLTIPITKVNFDNSIVINKHYTEGLDHNQNTFTVELTLLAKCILQVLIALLQKQYLFLELQLLLCILLLKPFFSKDHKFSFYIPPIMFISSKAA